jgi:hypothetical protein
VGRRVSSKWNECHDETKEALLLVARESEIGGCFHLINAEIPAVLRLLIMRISPESNNPERMPSDTANRPAQTFKNLGAIGEARALIIGARMLLIVRAHFAPHPTECDCCDCFTACIGAAAIAKSHGVAGPDVAGREHSGTIANVPRVKGGWLGGDMTGAADSLNASGAPAE